MEVLCSTVQGLSKIPFVLFIFLFLSSSCQKRGDDLPRLLKNHYANLEINNPEKKAAVIRELEQILSTHSLNKDSLHKVQIKLNELNDGHVVLYDEKGEIKKGHGESGLIFFTGSTVIASCLDCSPPLQTDKYSIVKINDKSFGDWLENSRYFVAASSEWGREFRSVRELLSERMYADKIELTVQDSTGKIRKTIVTPKNKSSKAQCITGQRLNDSVFKINIHSLWCDYGKSGLIREIIRENFNQAWEKIVHQVKPDDKIILDLRENGGGGDDEVKIVIRTFFARKVFMDQYQYLFVHQPGWKKWLPFSGRWAKPEDEFIESQSNSGKLKNNKMTALISAGCFSSCETIASILKQEKRAPLIGSRTHGGSGDPKIFPIKNSPFAVNLPTCLVKQKNNSFFEGVGVEPDYAINQRHNSTADDVLQYAIKVLH